MGFTRLPSTRHDVCSNSPLVRWAKTEVLCTFVSKRLSVLPNGGFVGTCYVSILLEILTLNISEM